MDLSFKLMSCILSAHFIILLNARPDVQFSYRSSDSSMITPYAFLEQCSISVVQQLSLPVNASFFPMPSSYPSNYDPMARDLVKAYPNLIQGLTEEKAVVSIPFLV